MVVTPVAASQPLVISLVAASSCAGVGKTAPELSGSFAARSAGTTPRFDEVVVADRVAVALQLEELALVGVEVLHPQLGGVGMRCGLLMAWT